MIKRLRISGVVLIGLCLGLALPVSSSAASSVRTLIYDGFRVVVPSAWPVYDLAADPTICVRFNRHAVYLGRPGSEQRCPAHSVGRTEAILISPASGAPLGATQAPERAAVVSVPTRGVVVLATWSGRQAVIERALGISAPRLDQDVSRPALASRARRLSPAARARPSKAASVYTGLGFDACTTPSSSQMSAWRRSPYRAVGIYIGGTNVGCAQPNLTPAWVSSEIAAGWHLIPTYVGLQAPHNSCGCASITPSHAATQGSAAAADAITQAQALGIGAGNPIYFDMEAYAPGKKTTSAVLTFLAAWTAALHGSGYLSGVYSSGASGIADLVAADGTTYTEPDDLWIADWNGSQSVTDPYVPSADWSSHQRLHQYSGGVNATYGGTTINIDQDYLDGPTVGSGAGVGFPSIPDGTFVQVGASGGVFRIAGGAPLFISDWSAVGGPQPVQVISQAQFAALPQYPRNGTFLQSSTGSVYRVAGGAPMYVSNPSLFGTTLPLTGVDQWDFDNVTNPAAHLAAVPKNGTFLTTTSGNVYRVEGGAPFPVTGWTLYGGQRPSMTIDQWDIDNLGAAVVNLTTTPADGTVVWGLPSGIHWTFEGGLRDWTATAAPGPIGVPDAALSVFPIGVPAPNCVVPNVKRMTVSRARRALSHAYCRLGKVSRSRRAGNGRILRVIAQSVHARARRPFAFAVAVVVG